MGLSRDHGYVGRHSGGREPVSFWKVLVVVALAIELVVIVYLASNRGTPADVASSPDVTEEPRTSHFSDDQLGYSFSYPRGWKVESGESVTKLVAPGNEIAIAVGPAPPGDVFGSSDQLVAGLSQRYADARTRNTELVRANQSIGVSTTGTAVNELGVKLRFALVAIEGDRQNYAITSFAAASVTERKADEALQEVLDDFSFE